MCQFSGKMNNFDFFGPNFPENWLWDLKFKNLIEDLRSAPPTYHVYQFSIKMNNFEFFDLNWGNYPITCNILVLTTVSVANGSKNSRKYHKRQKVIHYSFKTYDSLKVS